MSPGWVGCQPSSSRVSVLEAGLSTPRKPASQPKCSAASSGEMAATGHVEVPADHLGDVADRHALVGDARAASIPAGACSSARRNRCAASSRCTAGQRLEPSPM